MSDPVPQPVMRNAAATALALWVLAQVAVVTSYYGWWTPPSQELLMWAGVFGDIVGVVLLVQGWFVHKKVTPLPTVKRRRKAQEPLPLPSEPVIVAEKRPRTGR